MGRYHFTTTQQSRLNNWTESIRMMIPRILVSCVLLSISVTTSTPLQVASIKEGPPREMMVSKGSNVTLPCIAVGYPAPDITWTVNGAVITDDDRTEPVGNLSVTWKKDNVSI